MIRVPGGFEWYSLNALLMHCVGVGLAEAVKLGTLDEGFLRNCFQLAQEVPIGPPFPLGDTRS